MNRNLLDLLRCPYTKSELQLDDFETNSDEVEYGILRSEYSEYPIISGIPILISGKVDLLDLLKTGRLHEATALAVFGGPPRTGLGRLGNLFESNYTLRHLGHKIIQIKQESWLAEASQALFPRQTPQLSLKQLLNLAFRHYRHRPEGYNYNYYRFSPRYFIAMSFVAAIQPTNGPVLDLSCGAGHLLFQIQNHIQPQPAVGLDTLFISLYIARRFLAPSSWLVCSDAWLLPFRDNAFSTIFCSDAFHYFSRKWACVREVERTTTPSGDLMLIYLINKFHPDLYPSRPLTPEGYRLLVQHLSHRVFPDKMILGNYFEGKGLPAGEQADQETLNQSPRISIWARKSGEEFRDCEAFQTWPHARGPLHINPIYQQQDSNGDKSAYILKFPSDWYRDDNPGILQFMPQQFVLTENQKLAMGENRVQELKPLIQQWAILNLPPGYIDQTVK